MIERVRVQVNGKWFVVEVDDLDTDPVRAVVDDHVVEVSLASGEPAQIEAQASIPTTPVRAPAPAAPVIASRPAQPTPPPSAPQPVGAGASATKAFNAPMPGTVLSILVAVGDQVETGDTVCILEAMKMQQTLRVEWSGVVKAVHVGVGQMVLGGAPILELE